MGLSIQEILQGGLQELSLPFNSEQVEKTLAYLNLLYKWNEKYNLVAESAKEHIVTRHILDSLSIQKYVNGKHVLDVGSGAGFPGIPLAIFKPQQQFTLLDCNGKKTRFLFKVKTDLSLENVSIEESRVEHYQTNQRIDMLTCRAFAELAEIVRKAKHLLSQKCKLLAMKGKFPGEEIKSLPKEFVVLDSAKINVPGDDGERHLMTLVRS